MYQWKSLVFILLVFFIVSCSSDPKKGSTEKEASLNLYDLPETVDLEKAARLNMELGLGYLKQGQISRAKSKFLRALRLGPHLSEVHCAYAYFQEQTGEIEEAEKSYRKAIRLNPKSGAERNNYGTFLCRQHRYRQAEKAFLQAATDPLYTNMAEVFENAGLCILQVPDNEKAMTYFEKALRYDPHRSNALLELAILYFQAQRWQEAQEHYKHFTSLSNPTARSSLLGRELAKRAGDADKVASYDLLLRSQFPEAKLSDLASTIDKVKHS